MGAKADQAERRVVEQRARITKMLADLEHRVEADIDGVRSNVSERASQIGERASSIGDRVPGGERVHEQVTRHPFVSMLGGFGTGVALGMASTALGGEDERGASSGRGERARDRGGRSQGGGGNSQVMDMLTSTLIGVAAGPVKDEMQTLVRQAVSGFLGTDARPPAASDSAPAPGSGPARAASVSSPSAAPMSQERRAA